MVTGFVFCLCIITLFIVLCWWLCIIFDLCNISFSDQEPPYSMITLHEMAETGIKALCWAFQLWLTSKRNNTNPKPLFSLQRKMHLSWVCWGVGTRTKFCPPELHWAHALAWVCLNSVKVPMWNLQKQPMDGHKHTVVALKPKPPRVAVCSWAGASYTCTQTWAKPVCSGVSTEPFLCFGSCWPETSALLCICPSPVPQCSCRTGRGCFIFVTAGEILPA